MSKRKRVKHRKPKRRLHEHPHFLLALVVSVVVVFALVRSVMSGKNQGGTSYNLNTGCALTTTRPCFDKLTSSGTNILGKNGVNTFTACVNNSAPNRVGQIIQKTVVANQEKVTYCYDGNSNNYIRKFTGESDVTPPPNPSPTPPPSVTPTPGSSPFRVVYPNGGEQLAYGTPIKLQWEGGDTSADWPIFLSIINENRTQTLRELVVSTTNDQYEDYIVDLPLGNYILYAQGCRFCSSNSQWDYSNSFFSVVAGVPIEKINSNNPANQSLVVLSPSGGEAWDTGATQTIKWSGGTNEWPISISLIDNTNWTTYTTLYQSVTNDGAESWVVPAYVPPGSYKMYINCSNCQTPPSGYTGGVYAYGFNAFTKR